MLHSHGLDIAYCLLALDVVARVIIQLLNLITLWVRLGRGLLFLLDVLLPLRWEVV